MSDFMLSCSSTVDVPRKMLEERGIRYVYFHLSLNGQEYLDNFGESISQDEVYRRMLAGEKAKTSQVSVEDYTSLFTEALEAGKDILHITLSSGISGTYNAALVAKADLEPKYPDRKIYIVDSLNATGGYALLVLKAAELRDEGKDIDTIYQWLLEHRLEIQSWVMTSDLTFLIKGGRISKTAGFFGSMMNICPIIEILPDGSLGVREKIRTKKRAMKRMVDLMVKHAKDGTAYAGTCFLSNSTEADAKALADMVTAEIPAMKDKLVMNTIGGTIGCHTGPGTVTLFFWGDKRTP